MTPPGSRPAFRASLALLFVALGAGVPVRGHAEHEGDGAHIGAPEHAHGLALVQHEMRSERPSPPAFTAGPTATIIVPVLPLRPRVSVQRDEPCPKIRAPPTARPRAPPA